MALTTIDPTSALVVIDLRKGIVAADPAVTAVVKQAAHLAAEFRRHSVERVFPKIGETALTAEVIETVEATR